MVGCTAHFWISLIVKAAAFRLSNSNAGSGIHEWTTKTATETKETLCQGAFRGCLELQHHHRLRCSVILNQMPLMSERTVWRLARPQGPVFWSNALNHFSDVEWVKAFSYVAAYTWICDGTCWATSEVQNNKLETATGASSQTCHCVVVVCYPVRLQINHMYFWRLNCHCVH